MPIRVFTPNSRRTDVALHTIHNRRFVSSLAVRQFDFAVIRSRRHARQSPGDVCKTLRLIYSSH